MKTWISIGLLTLVTLLQNGECTINSWTTPSIATGDGGSGTLTSTVDNGATTGSTLGITIVATSSGTVNAYTLTSQTPTDVTFAIDNSGVLTIGSGTVAYATTSVYTLVITAGDDASATGSASVTLSINDLPAFAATQYGYTIADAAAAGTTLATHTATDVVNSGSLTYSFSSGNTNTDFAVSSSGVITTANAMAASTLGGYSLVLEAADATLTGTTTVWVVVTSCSSGAAGILAGVMTLLMAMTATLY
ncbi:cadherin EGF LAG seven-pass G-type receptor 2-like [Mercenaria mercenaria]|uniref:cadherin EGF LAG seven-pass G-type receptor 2-like n=1 Tax=Mercenaria mercenaria TaxID=6596 RepID=UPI00234ED799|nr:cadherin EGF LAG seven-pass G-type receptor 2-like [Mercenaria mercenaria]